MDVRAFTGDGDCTAGLGRSSHVDVVQRQEVSHQLHRLIGHGEAVFQLLAFLHPVPGPHAEDIALVRLGSDGNGCAHVMHALSGNRAAAKLAQADGDPVSLDKVGYKGIVALDGQVKAAVVIQLLARFGPAIEAVAVRGNGFYIHHGAGSVVAASFKPSPYFGLRLQSQVVHLDEVGDKAAIQVQCEGVA